MLRVDEAIKDAKAIRSAIDGIARLKEKAALLNFGVAVDDSSDAETDSSDEDDESAQVTNESPSVEGLKPLSSFPSSELLSLIRQSQCNWFEILQALEEAGYDSQGFDSSYKDLNLLQSKVNLLDQSYAAYHQISDELMPQQEREAACVNDFIVSESDSDHPDDEMKIALKKKIDAIRRKCRRDRAKALADKRFLSRKIGRKVRGIIHDLPDIGQTIEEFVKERSVGADAWRRTRVLTFDGNKAVKEKVRIQAHL